MVDSVAAPQGFTTIKYTTKDGEHISATKNNGVVTLIGDKNGVRQIPLEDFKKELIANIADIQLEKTPEKDTVEIATKATPAAAQLTPSPAVASSPAIAVSPAVENSEATKPKTETEEAKKLDLSA